ncbi:MAG: cytochrome C oxidase subunit IV family protein, partial [Verrucomicrobiae bacterium]|nr:cytochrome C oxidase subunit IV family protein [Verrucomicrobiae bacterium]
MSATSHPDIQKKVSVYWKVFWALLVATVITVAIANVHMGILLGIVVALIVALVKGSLVAGYFMHLFHEVRWVYGILALTAFFFVAMIVLIVWTHADQQGHNSG